MGLLFVAKRWLHRIIATALTLAFFALFVAARVLVAFDDETYGNCFLYGIRRLHRDGGMCLVSWSRYGPWPHVEWASATEVYSYDPITPKRQWAKARQIPLWFRGHVTRRGTPYGSQ